MDILLKGTIVVDPSSPLHLQQADILIQNGYVAEIGTLSQPADRTVDVEGLHVTPGFVDIFSHFCDPGLEVRETLQSGSNAAAAGGYTNVILLPNTTPTIHDKASVEYMLRQTASLPIDVHPLGAVTKNAEGKDLAEMYDMANSGAIGFSDGLCPIQSAGLLLKALQYIKPTGKVLVQVPDDRSFSNHGLMNEGIASTRLGLAGKPAVAEELMIARDIELLRYTDSNLHITGVSSAKGIDLVRKAKADGLRLTCSVSPNHLFFSDEDLFDYNTNLKLTPPLRTTADRASLHAAVLDGTVDCIASHHLPQHIDQKLVEFEYAKPGTISLETAFAAVATALPELSLNRLVQFFSISPRSIFGLAQPTIQPGQRASLTLLLPTAEWIPEKFLSRSRNSAFIGKTLTGKPLGIIHKDGLFLRP